MKGPREGEVHPFQVGYNLDTGYWYIFAPIGCVLVGGVAVETGADQYSNVQLSLTADSFPTALYAHVTEQASATGGHIVTFDGNATLTGAKFNFKVCSFGSTENDGEQYDLCMSVVNLGGEGGGGGVTLPKACFDLEERESDGTATTYIVRCQIPAPETTYSCSDFAIDTSSSGSAYLNVTRNTGSYTIAVSQTQGASDSTHASWRLWSWDGNGFIDYRPRILPLYAF